MDKKIKDRHLDTPSEANRDKHINFAALENEEDDLADQPATGKLNAAKDSEAGIDNDNSDKKQDRGGTL